MKKKKRLRRRKEGGGGSADSEQYKSYCCRITKRSCEERTERSHARTQAQKIVSVCSYTETRRRKCVARTKKANVLHSATAMRSQVRRSLAVSRVARGFRHSMQQFLDRRLPHLAGLPRVARPGWPRRWPPAEISAIKQRSKVGFPALRHQPSLRLGLFPGVCVARGIP